MEKSDVIMPVDEMDKYSKAKWDCLWCLMVWSFNIIIASQFLCASEHKIFYASSIVATIAVPILTARYCNSSGKNASHLLSACSVICDPVLAWLSVCPSLTLRAFPGLAQESGCLQEYDIMRNWSNTFDCLKNSSSEILISWRWMNKIPFEEQFIGDLIHERVVSLHILELLMFMPILMAFIMGRRSSRIQLKSITVNLIYWVVTSAECFELLDQAYYTSDYRNACASTVVLFNIVSVVCNSYAVITFSRFISPVDEYYDEKLKDKQDNKEINLLRNRNKSINISISDDDNQSKNKKSSNIKDLNCISQNKCSGKISPIEIEIIEEREDNYEYFDNSKSPASVLSSAIADSDSNTYYEYKDDEEDNNCCDSTYRIACSLPVAMFIEFPLIIARFQMFELQGDNLLPISFYAYWIKNIFLLSIISICLIIYGMKMRKKRNKITDEDNTIENE